MPNPNKGEVRIIGGQWRGRKLRFPAIAGLRPTPDRVRETLFNWLAPVIQGAHCLDLFAGSGALGFEALSRGASSVIMIDQAQPVTRYLQEQADLLQAENSQILCAQLPNGLSLLPQKKFDIVFLDPPYRQNLLLPCCQWLQTQHMLADEALIYIEAETELNIIDNVPIDWQLLRDKKAGQVGYYLLNNSNSA